MTLRSAVPEVLVALVHALFLIVAVLVLDPLLGLCGLVCLIGVGAAVRWYLRRARPAYLAVAATGAELADVVASTAKGARTIELLGLEHRRAQAAEAAITQARSARLGTLWLRTVLFPWSEVSLALPVVGVLLVGGALHANDLVSLGVVVTATVYLRQLVGPLDTLMLWIEQLQGAGASYARVEGLADIPDEDPEPRPRRPADGPHRGEQRPLRLHGRLGTCCMESTCWCSPASGWPSLAPPEQGKSTLARLLAGLDRPHTGSVTMGGTPVADLPPDQLREHVVLITQDHHVFHDTVRDNLRVAKPNATDEELYAALDAVGAAWFDDLPHGLDTEVGDDISLDGARAQQFSLARVVLADPHTLILDEATALLDPKPRGNRAVAGRRPARSHGHRDRPPAADRARRRPNRGHGSRRTRRARHPRRTRQRRTRLRQTLAVLACRITRGLVAARRGNPPARKRFDDRSGSARWCCCTSGEGGGKIAGTVVLSTSA